MISQSKILFFLSLSFVLGIFTESILLIPQIFIWGILFISVFAIFASFFIKKINFIIGFCLLFILIGILRMQISEFNINQDVVSKYNNKGEISLVGVIYSEPDVRDSFQKFKLKINDSVVLVTTKKYPEYKYLDEIKVIGELETPGQGDGTEPSASYKNYLMKDHVYSVINFPKIEFISTTHNYNFLSWIYEKILFFKQKVRENIRSNFLPPYSSILEGTILGDNGAMTTDLKDKLNVTGLRHVIAVSGTHVVILSSIILSLLMAVGFWRGQAFYITIIFIFVYIVLTGLPPSGIRAGIMGGVYLLSQKIGRQTIGSRLIVLACALMLIINPLFLVYDIGFQLSFLAVLGLIYLEPIIKTFLKKIIKYNKENQTLDNLLGIVSTTFAAQIFTLPIMVYNFGNISLVAPITNLLVLPVVYWLMIFGFLSSVLGVFSNIVGWLFSIPCWFILSYFVKIIDIFSQPWMIKMVQDIHWIWLLISYFIIVCITVFLNKKYSSKLV